MQIVAVGDVMPGGVLNGTNKSGVSKEIESFLKAADLVVGTLETAVGNEPSFYEEKMKRLGDVIYVEDADLERLKILNIGVVSLANNHFFDLGVDGANHAICLLDQLGILHCGAGGNLEEAQKPAVFEKNGETFAVLGFCDWRDETVGWCPIATKDSPGVNPLVDDYVVAEIKKYAKIYNHVIVVPHWGKEYQIWPKPYVVELTKKMLNAGADVILGSHTHCVQPVVKRKNNVVVYSMGNFLFPDRLITKPRSTFYSHPNLDVSTLPKTDGYPYVETPTFKVWKSIARIGMIVSLTFENEKLLIEKKYTSLSLQNEVDFLPLKKIRKLGMKLFVLEKLLSINVYSFVFNLLINVKRKLKGNKPFPKC